MGAIDGHGQSWKADRIDRSWTTTSLPQLANAYGVYQLPFGKGHIGNDSWVARTFASGWQLSGIHTYTSGGPFAVVWNTGGNCANAAPNAGQCMPSLNPSYSGSARINGSYGSGPNGFQACNIGLGSSCVARQYVHYKVVPLTRYYFYVFDTQIQLCCVNRFANELKR